MNPNVLCRTEQGNNYLYNFNMNHFMLLHPVTRHLLSLVREGTDLEKWLEDLPEPGIQVEDIGPVSKKEIQYYYKKYRFQLEAGFFKEVNKEERFGGTVTPFQVQWLLANVIDVVFEVTDACNLKCKYCGYGEYYENYDKRESRFLDFDRARKLLDYLVEHWNSPLNNSHKSRTTLGFYGGEPLMNVDLIKKIIRYTENLKIRNNFTFRMTTNALLLDKYMDFLVENDFGILISLDGNKEHTGYRVLHDGSNAFNIIMKNVSALRDRYPDYFEKRVNFNAVLHNKNNVPDVFQFFKNHFDKKPTISSLNFIGIKQEKREEFWEMYRHAEDTLQLSEDPLALEKEVFQRLPNIKMLSSIIHNCSGYCYDNYNRLLYSNTHSTRIPTGTCLPFSKKIFLSINGKIMPCERIGHDFYFGTVDEKGVHLNIGETARAANKYFDGIRNKCLKCMKADICQMCVYNLKVGDDGQVKNCQEFADYQKFSNYLSSCLTKLEKHPEYYNRIMDEVFVA